jgi:hypothetical protein
MQSITTLCITYVYIVFFSFFFICIDMTRLFSFHSTLNIKKTVIFSFIVKDVSSNHVHMKYFIVLSLYMIRKMYVYVFSSEIYFCPIKTIIYVMSRTLLFYSSYIFDQYVSDLYIYALLISVSDKYFFYCNTHQQWTEKDIIGFLIDNSI